MTKRRCSTYVLDVYKLLALPIIVQREMVFGALYGTKVIPLGA